MSSKSLRCFFSDQQRIGGMQRWNPAIEQRLKLKKEVLFLKRSWFTREKHTAPRSLDTSNTISSLQRKRNAKDSPYRPARDRCTVSHRPDTLSSSRSEAEETLSLLFLRPVPNWTRAPLTLPVIYQYLIPHSPSFSSKNFWLNTFLKISIRTTILPNAKEIIKILPNKNHYK